MALTIHEDWAEIIALLLAAFGFIIAVALRNPLFSYFTILLSGFLAGRLFYMRRFKEPIFPFILIIVGFLFGYLIGGFWISRFWAFVFFGIAFSVSYYLHLKKIFVIFKSEPFINR